MLSRRSPFFLVLFAIVGCTSSDSDNAESRAAAVATYADIVFASYEDSLAAAQELQTSLADFTAAPSEESLASAKAAWLAAREPYGQTEAYRFYGGPIDDEDGPEALLNAWPLDEAYIDYVEGDAEAGLINAVTEHPELTADLLISSNEAGAEENVSVGFHAIEFLLWGQDFNDDGPGARPFNDYVDGEGQNAGRRATYLNLTAELLVGHLQELVNEWDPAGTENYRTAFLSQSPNDALQSVLTGIGVLSKSELAGERIFTALDNQSQEDEHSCFSDNTHRDMVTNAQGIANVLRGSYRRTDGTEVTGTGLLEVIAEIDAELASDLEQRNEASLEAVGLIPVPFDRAIVVAEQRDLVLESVYRLQEQGDKIADAATALGLIINTALPE
ncbi:MAG: imelysin family protein [Acidobacteriota bacterium]